MLRAIPVKRQSEGAVLLLVLLTVTLLLVVVGQLSYSSSLDKALAENEVKEAQATLDIQSAIAVLLKALERDRARRSLALNLTTGTASISWQSEAGKFNLNRLREGDNLTAVTQFERLFQILEDQKILPVLGLGAKIMDFVMRAKRPLLTIKELLKVEEVTPEILRGDDQSRGLADYLTVYSDGRINISEAPPEVIAALGEGINNKKTIDLLRRKLIYPEIRVPNYIEVLAKRLRDSVTTDSEAYTARISLKGHGIERFVDLAIRKEDGKYRVVLYNEVDTSHERFRP